MDDEKWPLPFRNDEDRLKHFFDESFERGESLPLRYSAAMLVKSIERLKTSIDKNLESINDLKASMEKSSGEANGLSVAIKKFTVWLVGLTVAAVALAGLSLYVLLRSHK